MTNERSSLCFLPKEGTVGVTATLLVAASSFLFVQSIVMLTNRTTCFCRFSLAISPLICDRLSRRRNDWRPEQPGTLSASVLLSFGWTRRFDQQTKEVPLALPLLCFFVVIRVETTNEGSSLCFLPKEGTVGITATPLVTASSFLFA